MKHYNCSITAVRSTLKILTLVIVLVGIALLLLFWPKPDLQAFGKPKHFGELPTRIEPTFFEYAQAFDVAKRNNRLLFLDFLKTNGSVELNMDVTNKSQVLTNLERNEIDFAMVSTLPKNIQIEKIELMPNKLFLVGSTKSPTIKKLDSKVVHNSTFIYREQGSATR